MACYECYTVQCAYTGVSKNISSWYSSLGPNTHANLRQCARKKWVYFHNNKMYEKKLPTIKKRWCIQTPPCYWIYNQNVCNVVRCNGFFSSCSFHFCSHYYYRQSASLIYSDLCLVVHFIYAFFALFFSQQNRRKRIKNKIREKRKISLILRSFAI